MIEKRWKFALDEIEVFSTEWHWEQSIVSVDSSWGIGRRDGRTGQGQDEPDRTILLQHFSDLRTRFEVNGQINLCLLLAIQGQVKKLSLLGVLEGTADKASSSRLL
ncbi:hypothetical protein ACJX0J_002861, partial [Zea mays]